MRHLINTVRYLGLALIISVTLSCSNSQDSIVESQEVASSYKVDFVPAKTNGELDALRKQKNNMIRSKADLDKILADRTSALSSLDPVLLKDFVNGLVFRDGVGVVGIAYNTLKRNIPVDQYNQIMKLFGIDTKAGFWGGASNNPNLKTAEDYQDFFCQSPGTCYRDTCCICLTGC